MSKRTRTFESGSTKRKKKSKQEELQESLKDSLLQFLKKTPAAEEISEPNATLADQPSTSASDIHDKPSASEATSVLGSEDNGATTEMLSSEVQMVTEKEVISFKHFEDPGCWPSIISDKDRTRLVEFGPQRVTGCNYPVSTLYCRKRKFSNSFYIRVLSNGEMIDRKWLVYSKTKNAVFCFCCKLFSYAQINLVKDGYTVWFNLARDLREHENSSNHIDAAIKWTEFEDRLKRSLTIDAHEQRLVNIERKHWQNVLERIMSVVQFLSARNLAFRGTLDKLFEANNGNFLGLIELVSKYDVVLQEHMRRIKNKEIHDHYLGIHVQNELIALMGSTILEAIVTKVKAAKYYSIILDCTPDISHQEQMTVVIRIVDVAPDGSSIKIAEHFVGFLAVEDSSGFGLTEAVLQKLGDMNLSIEDCRGQGYDNGANMKGCNSGVQRRILDLNPRAFFVPCGCHSLNLLLCDMAKSCTSAVTLFGILQQIYVLFSASTQRWKIFKDNVKNLTVKPLSDTRWECRIESVKAVRFQIGEIYDALVEVAENANDPKARSEATGLAKEMKSYKFLVSLVIWYEILGKINLVSKFMQSKDMQIDVASDMIHQTRVFLQEYREIGFASAKQTAAELAKELEMDETDMQFPNIASVRKRKVRRQFDYEAADEASSNPEKLFEVNFFNVIIDQALASLNSRFEQLQAHNNTFNFLCKLENIKNLPAVGLMEKCTDLQTMLSHNAKADVAADDLASELKMVANLIPPQSNALAALKFVFEKKLNEIFPNVATALRILLTIPVTVASGERSFSKLKLIKNYLRSTMLQDRLTGLALLSIEKEIASTVDYSTLIQKFACAKARKVKF